MKKGTGGVMSLIRLKYSHVLVGCTLLLIAPACKKDHYTPHYFHQLNKDTPTNPGKKVELTVRPLTRTETKSLFDGHGNRLLRKNKPIYPLFLSIRNNTNHKYVIDRAHIGLTLASPQQVASRLYSHTARRVIGTIILGTVGTVATLFGGFYLIILGAIPAAGMPALIKAGYVTLGLSGLIAVSAPTVSYQQGASTYSYNCQIEQDVMAHTLVDPVVIESEHEFSCLLFVSRRSYRTSFSITLVDQHGGNPLSFDIELPKGGIPCER